MSCVAASVRPTVWVAVMDKLNPSCACNAVQAFWSQGKTYMSFKLEMERAELTFGLLAQLFEYQWKVTARESSLSSIFAQDDCCAVLASS